MIYNRIYLYVSGFYCGLFAEKLFETLTAFRRFLLDISKCPRLSKSEIILDKMSNVLGQNSGHWC